MSYYSLSPSTPGEAASRHDAIAAWFLGPKAENFSYLEEFLKRVLDNQKNTRKNLYPSDKAFITPKMQTSELFRESMKNLDIQLSSIDAMLSEHSTPFWSPRYNGHMNMDVSMPAIIGYLTTMIYNPNNVAFESSPFTTIIELTVGQQLCRMLGYHTAGSPAPMIFPPPPTSWGHITCDGSVANLEATWAARNLKFYPLSLRLATTEGMLKFLVRNERNQFRITLANGQRKPFAECTVWELLNLKPSTILDIPDRLFKEYGISQSFLQRAMDPFLIQTLGKDVIEKKMFTAENIQAGQILVGATRHYSWPKGAAIVGIGRNNVIDVRIDYAARMYVQDLEQKLENCVKTKTPVYMVVTIMGSTEQGAVDPLADILELRNKFEGKGLSFVVHCDAAWGGYFASMLRDLPTEDAKIRCLFNDPSYVPSMSLQSYTKTQLQAYGRADSITVDPHKSGYCPYPAGALCYRDERMRYQVTWTSPIVAHEGEAENIGVYGVEGSKPGAAAVGTYLSHEVIGLNYKGYGALLGEATFSCTRLFCHWATMTEDDDELIVRPFNLLPAEKENLLHGDPAKVAAQKQFIRDRIINTENSDLLVDKEVMQLLSELGSDLMINAFACNFKVNGKINTDVEEANYLNTRIFQRLSLGSKEDKAQERSLILTSSNFEQQTYRECLDLFKSRLGLKGDQDLSVLITVTMSPWPTANNFIKVIADEFEKVAREEIQGVLKRNALDPQYHTFVMQGTDKVHLVYLPQFNVAPRRYQVIMTCNLPQEVMTKYVEFKETNPGEFFTLRTADKAFLPDLLREGHFKAVMDIGQPVPGRPHLANNFEVTNIHAIVNEPLTSNVLDTQYPTMMPFYLYGTPQQQHIDHLLRVSPNQQLNSDRVSLRLSTKLTEEELSTGVVAVFHNIRECSMQPMYATPKYYPRGRKKLTSPQL
ncbi:PLP-dependent transferase [Terfezia boudieri ATCC MYA-4762]|uniref:PLP-dependent transferase n=1 Tax=Terfezia boudieri ATCC MYA-4762 TaxID=1051890 RepID=A0A3N4M002_9PEZI|nr:PLP-dependent transferase [Terfezia boudieri ATCC MYA-4762]